VQQCGSSQGKAPPRDGIRNSADGAARASGARASGAHRVGVVKHGNVVVPLEKVSDIVVVAVVDFINDPVIIVLQNKVEHGAATDAKHEDKRDKNPHVDRLHVLLPHLRMAT